MQPGRHIKLPFLELDPPLSLNVPAFYITTPELLAIRWEVFSKGPLLECLLGHTGHSSAASFPTGPVIADPFISPFGLTI